MKNKLTIIILLCIGGVLLMFGLFKIFKTENSGNGQVTNKTDYSAPKAIKSTELTSFYTSFYRISDEYYNVDRKYDFYMCKTDDGKYIISEGYYENELKCETDVSFANKLDKIIRDYDLISKNGSSKVTASLPPEYGPWEVKATYASNEKLYFHEDGNPQADWTRAVLNLFANEFSKNGIDDLLPAK